MYRIPAATEAIAESEGVSAIKPASELLPITQAQLWDHSESGLNVLFLVNERYPNGVHYCSCRFIHNLLRVDVDMASKLEKKRKKAVVQM